MQRTELVRNERSPMRDHLVKLGYKVAVNNTELRDWCVVRVTWGSMANPPRQIEMYFWDETFGPADIMNLDTAKRIGSCYPEPGVSGEETFTHVKLPTKFRPAFVPPLPTRLGFHVTRQFKHLYGLTLPGRLFPHAPTIDKFESEKEAWAKAAEIETLGGMNKYLSKIERVSIG